MPAIKRGYMSTSKIAKFFDVETGFLFNYLCEQGLLYKNENKNRFELTKIGISKGGKYQYGGKDDIQWVIWSKDFIYDDVFDAFILENSFENNEKNIVMNMWKMDDLKKLFKLIRNKKKIEDISKELNISEENIVKKINSLPRIKKLYKSYTDKINTVPLNDIDEEKEVKTKTEEYKVIIQLLSEGTNPFTGEVFDHTHICQNVNVVRALIESVKLLEKERKRQKRKTTLPLNAGKIWSEEEDEKLIQKFNEGMGIKELAKLFQRSAGSIRSRLLDYGILTQSDEI